MKVPVYEVSLPSGKVNGPTGSTVHVQVPAGGRVREGIGDFPTARTWEGPALHEGCRVRLSLNAFAVKQRDRSVETDQPAVAFRTLGGIRYARSVVKLDDTLSLFGYARFALPRRLVTPDRRLVYVYVYASVARDLDHCIRPLRAAGRPIAARALRSVVLR